MSVGDPTKVIKIYTYQSHFCARTCDGITEMKESSKIYSPNSTFWGKDTGPGLTRMLPLPPASPTHDNFRSVKKMTRPDPCSPLYSPSP